MDLNNITSTIDSQRWHNRKEKKMSDTGRRNRSSKKKIRQQKRWKCWIDDDIPNRVIVQATVNHSTLYIFKKNENDDEKVVARHFEIFKLISSSNYLMIIFFFKKWMRYNKWWIFILKLKYYLRSPQKE